MNIYLDIETVETGKPELKQHIEKKARKKYEKKYESGEIEEYDFEEEEEFVQKELNGLALDAAFGEIASIAVATGDKYPKAYFRTDYSIESEIEILSNFFSDFSKIKGKITIVGHNILHFDMQFIRRRAMIHGLKCPYIFKKEIKPWETEEVHDTMIMWAGQDLRLKISQDDLCIAFGLEGKGAVNGGDVARLWREGRFKEIADYNIDDVIKNQALYLKMTEDIQCKTE